MDDVKQPRREKAANTRKKIIEAAHEEFIEKGFHGATIASVSARAGVAAQTVYFVFHTKPQLISAVIDAAVMGDGAETPQETEWWAAMLAAPDPVTSLRAFIRGAAPLFARASAISEILRAAALTDEEVRATYDYHEELRREGFREVIAAAAKKGHLTRGLTVDSATDLFVTLYGDSVFVLMTRDRGWDEATWINWLCDELPRLLFSSD